MMHVSVSNFRGLADLRASIAPILLLAGDNGAGKSSACAAIAAAASGIVLPFEGMTKKAAGLLVKDGADIASVHLREFDREASATWPAVERFTAGDWQDISNVAAGLVDVAAVKPVERASLLIDLIGALPTAEDLTGEMATAKIPQAMADEAVKQLAKGWDSAHAYFKETGTKLKGRWEQVTGARFGKAKVIGWRPAEWQASMEGRTAEELAADITGAEAALEDLTGKAGASQAQMDAWGMLAAQLPQLRAALAAAETDHTNEVARAKKFTDALEEMGTRPQPGAEPLVCPCCRNALRVKDGALVKDSASDFAELSEAATEWDRAKATVDSAIQRRDLALTYVRSAERKVEEAEAAATNLQNQPEDTVSETDIADARWAAQKAKMIAEMRQKITDATALADKIGHVQTLIDLLDKDGLRQKKLAEALGDFNGLIVEVCQMASWAPVHVDADMGVTYGGRPVSLCSAGEQYRARVSLQLAVAIKEGASLAVIDGADILGKSGRNGLFGALKRLTAEGALHAVIGMTLLKREDMPDLAKAGMGASLWIEGGVAGARVREAA